MLFTRVGNVHPRWECNIPTKGEQHACYMAEHLTIDLLYNYHMHNMYASNITAHVKGD